MDPKHDQSDPEYEVEIIEDDTPDREAEVENIEKEGDPFGDNFA